MASGYQNIDQQQAAPVYTPAANTQPYADQEALYSGPTSYGSPSTSETTSERPSWLSIGGIVIIYDCVVLFLSFIASFITLILLKGLVATVHSGKAVGVNPVNIGFIGGFLSFFNLFLMPVFILIEIHFPMIVSRVPIATNSFLKAGLYLYLAFINFGFAGNFGIAVGVFMLISCILNAVVGFLNRN